MRSGTFATATAAALHPALVPVATVVLLSRARGSEGNSSNSLNTKIQTNDRTSGNPQVPLERERWKACCARCCCSRDDRGTTLTHTQTYSSTVSNSTTKRPKNRILNCKQEHTLRAHTRLSVNVWSFSFILHIHTHTSNSHTYGKRKVVEKVGGSPQHTHIECKVGQQQQKKTFPIVQNSLFDQSDSSQSKLINSYQNYAF